MVLYVRADWAGLQLIMQHWVLVSKPCCVVLYGADGPPLGR